MKPSIIILLMSFAMTSNAQLSNTGQFEYSTDVGNPSQKCSSVYNSTVQYYTLRGGGYNIWFERDEFHYLYNKIKGDFILTANFNRHARRPL